MWLQAVGLFVLLFGLLRWLSHADTLAQERRTQSMERLCTSSTVLRAPVQIIVVGTSEDIAHNLFEILQRAQCPRRQHIKVLEWPQPDEESAAILYNRSVSLRGLQDTSFSEQIQWTQWTSTREKHGIRPLMEISHMYDTQRPFTFVIFERLFLVQDWDQLVFDRLAKINHANTILCGTLPRWSRMQQTDRLKAQATIEWTPLAHETHEGLPIVVPSRMLCGDTITLRNFFMELALEQPSASVEEIPYLASLGSYDFQGLVIQREMPLWTAEEVPYTIRLKGPLSDRHRLGLCQTKWESPNNVEVISKQGSFGTFRDFLDQLKQ